MVSPKGRGLYKKWYLLVIHLIAISAVMQQLFAPLPGLREETFETYVPSQTPQKLESQGSIVVSEQVKLSEVDGNHSMQRERVQWSPYIRYDKEKEGTTSDSFETPKVAWLVSFPNSGTSYTLNMAMRVSKTTAASNYHNENRSVPLYPSIAHGPMLLTTKRGYSLPTRYALTKTHCGGFSKMRITQERFQKKCLGEKQQYPESLVARAVHLVRDPFDNAVSRFHHYWKEKATDANEYRRKHPYNSTQGFLKYCREQDALHWHWKGKKEEFLSTFNGTWVLLRKVPCHVEFLRYIHWHNLAEETAAKLGLPTYILHYENYATDFDQVRDELMGFLELEAVDKDGAKEIIAGKSYRNYFTEEQRAGAFELMQKAASPNTWEIVERYVY